MIADYQKNVVYLSSLLKTENYKQVYADLISVLRGAGLNPSFIDNSRDLWCRDFMPVQISSESFVRFRYFPKRYLNYNNFEQLTRQNELKYNKLTVSEIADADLFLEEGDMVYDDTILFISENVISNNPGKSVDDIIRIIRETMQAEKLIFVPGLPESDIPLNCMLRIFDKDTILTNDFSSESDKWRSRFFSRVERADRQVIKLPFSRQGTEGHFQSYLTYVRVGNMILFPLFHNKSDDQAAYKIFNLLLRGSSVKIELFDASLIKDSARGLNNMLWCVMEKGKINAIDYIIPYAYSMNTLLVCHTDDASHETGDFPVVNITPVIKDSGSLMSLKKALKETNGFKVIPKKERERFKPTLLKYLSDDQISNIYKLLANRGRDVGEDTGISAPDSTEAKIFW